MHHTIKKGRKHENSQSMSNRPVMRIAGVIFFLIITSSSRNNPERMDSPAASADVHPRGRYADEVKLKIAPLRRSSLSMLLWQKHPQRQKEWKTKTREWWNDFNEARNTTAMMTNGQKEKKSKEQKQRKSQEMRKARLVARFSLHSPFSFLANFLFLFSFSIIGLLVCHGSTAKATGGGIKERSCFPNFVHETRISV